MVPERALARLPVRSVRRVIRRHGATQSCNHSTGHGKTKPRAFASPFTEGATPAEGASVC